MKKLALLLAVFFAANALAIGFETDKSVYEKHDAIKISGSCSLSVPEKLSATSDGLEIFSTDIECHENGSFGFDYQTSYLDHTGEWSLDFYSKQEKFTKTIFVKEVREAGFFLVRFLSPTEGQYQRKQKLLINVEVIDSGEHVNDAQVVVWGAKGEKLSLQNNNNGQYILEYAIPVDAPQGDWTMEVLAQSKKGGQFFGGIGKLKLSLLFAPILIEVLSPNVSYFEQGDTINFDITAKYADGTPLSRGKVSMNAGETTQELQQIDADRFTGTFKVPPGFSGATKIELKAADFADNSSTKKIDIIAGCSVTCIIKQYGLFAAAFLIIVLALGRIFLTHFSFKGKKQALEKEKEKLNSLIADLQKEYFSKGVMPASSYKKNLSDYKSRLMRIEQELLELKRKEEAQ